MASSKPSLTPSEWIDLVIARAPDLRRAGVTSLAIDKVVIALLPPEIEPDQADHEQPDPADAFDDAATYGGRGIPSYRHDDEDEGLAL